MTEQEARNWLDCNFSVSRETWGQLERFVIFLQNEARDQNLIAASTLEHIWARHIVDSAQLLNFAPEDGDWLDLGAGAGFPGVVAALLGKRPVTLVESRSKRVDYLSRLVDHLDLQNSVSIVGMPVERMETKAFAVISARAFAPLPKLLDLAVRFSTGKTIWLLPKGRNAAIELNEARENWEIDFHVKPSVTDNEAGILVGRVLETQKALVKPRRTGKRQKWQ